MRTALIATLMLLSGLAALAMSVRRESSAKGSETASRIAAVAMARGEIDVASGVTHVLLPVDGVIAAVSAGEDEFVSKGQVLATLDQQMANLTRAAAQAAVAESQARLALLKSQLILVNRRQKREIAAAAEDASSPQALDEARFESNAKAAEVKSAKANLRSAELSLRSAELAVDERAIRAPTAGRIAVRSPNACVGCIARSGSELFVLIPHGPLVVRAQLDEDLSDRVQPGMPAEIAPEIHPELHYRGRVIRVGTLLRRSEGDATDERRDVRTLDCLLSIEPSHLIVGQRVLVRFLQNHAR